MGARCVSWLILLQLSSALVHGYDNVGFDGWYQPVPHRPVDIITDVINDLGVRILQQYTAHGNVAFSPTGVGFVLAALYEGSAGRGRQQIADALGLPRDRDVTRIGYRDIHRRLRTYLNADGFLGGLTLNQENTRLRSEYEDVLRFYGFDLSIPEEGTNETTSAPETTTNMVATEQLTTEARTLVSDETTTMQQATTTVKAMPSSETTISETQMSTTSPIELLETTMSMTDEQSRLTQTVSGDTVLMDATKTDTTVPSSTMISFTETIMTSPPPSMSTTIAAPITTVAIETTSDGSQVTVVNVTQPTTVISSTTPVPSTKGTPSSTPSPSTEGTPSSTPSTLTTTTTTVTTTTTTTPITTSTLPSSSTSMVENSGSTTITVPPSDQPTETGSDAIESVSESMTPSTPASTMTETITVVSSSTVEPTTPSVNITEEVSTSSTIRAQADTTTAGVVNGSPDENTVSTDTSNNQPIPSEMMMGSTDLPVTTVATSEIGSTVQLTTVSSTMMNRKKRSIRSPRGFFSSYPDEGIWMQDLGIWKPYSSSLNEASVRDSTEISFLVNGCDVSSVTATRYFAVLPFAYFPSLHAVVVEFPLDDPRYNIILMMSTDRRDTYRLARDLGGKSLRLLRKQLQATWVRATIPSFMLRGFVTLTSFLQRLGVLDVFEPRSADLSPMTPDLGVYARDVQQSIGVNIRNYMKPDRTHSRNGLFERAGPVPFTVVHPFLYFIVDAETSVTLIAGRVNDPLNSRIL